MKIDLRADDTARESIWTPVQTFYEYNVYVDVFWNFPAAIICHDNHDYYVDEIWDEFGNIHKSYMYV